MHDLEKLVQLIMDTNQRFSIYWARKTAEHLLKSGVVVLKNGRWIYHIDDLSPSESTQECSCCHEEESITLQNENYCPNCGAKMDGGDSNVQTD